MDTTTLSIPTSCQNIMKIPFLLPECGDLILSNKCPGQEPCFENTSDFISDRLLRIEFTNSLNFYCRGTEKVTLYGWSFSFHVAERSKLKFLKN